MNHDKTAQSHVEGRRPAPVAGCSQPMATTTADTLQRFPKIMAALHEAERQEE